MIWGTYALAHQYLSIYVCVLVGKYRFFYLGVYSVIYSFVCLLFIKDLLCASTCQCYDAVVTKTNKNSYPYGASLLTQGGEQSKYAKK